MILKHIPKLSNTNPKMSPKARYGHNPYDNILFATLSCHFCNISHAKSPFLNPNINQHGSKMAPKSPKIAQDEPKMAQRWPKMAPRLPKMSPR